MRFVLKRRADISKRKNLDNLLYYGRITLCENEKSADGAQ